MRKSRLAALAAFATAGITSAMAAVPADVTLGLTDLKSDAITVAGVILVAIVAVFAVKFIRKGL